MSERRLSNEAVSQLATASGIRPVEPQEMRKGSTVPVRDYPPAVNSGSAGLDVYRFPESGGRAGGKRPAVQPPTRDPNAYRDFRRLCDRLVEEAGKLDDYLAGNQVADEGLEVIVEMESLLENLYDCPWGEAENLKRIVVAIQSQVHNAQWTAQHVRFVQDVLPFLRARYHINEDTVNECLKLIKEHGLDLFRGTVSEPNALRRYRLQEVVANELADPGDAPKGSPAGNHDPGGPL